MAVRLSFWAIFSILVLHFFDVLKPEDFVQRNYDEPISPNDVFSREIRVDDDDEDEFSGTGVDANREVFNQKQTKPDTERDGVLYNKKRDPPGQKCAYIYPGDTSVESYRFNTYKKFGQEVPVDTVLLAKHGFSYIGYKDRVKCFSCGANVYNWQAGDDPRHRRWHFYGCAFASGNDDRNVPIISGRAIDFVGDFVTTTESLDSGYMSANSSNVDVPSSSIGIVQPQTAREGVVADRVTPPPSISSPESNLTRRISGMQIGNEGRPVNDITPLNQTARVQQGKDGRKFTYANNFKLAVIDSSYHFDLLTKTLDLRKEADRRKSFFGWTDAHVYVTPQKLAKSGFFYLGNSDRVQCFSCSGVLRNWSSNDDVDVQHSSYFPSCKMVLGTESTNVPLLVEPRAAESSVGPSKPTVSLIDERKRQFPCLHPINPHMRNFESRVATFDHKWQRFNVKASIQDIARAGFYFLGVRDRAKCWYCNGGLQNWEPDDEPFTEHAKWFPGCEFILQLKGFDFVKNIASKFANLNRPPLRYSRFDISSMELVPVTGRTDQKQPVVVDPQSNSAGAVLNSLPSSSSQNSMVNGSANSASAFERQAVNMGFAEAKVKRVVNRRIQNQNKNFDNVEELIEALLQESSSSGGGDVSPSPQNHNSPENNGSSRSNELLESHDVRSINSTFEVPAEMVPCAAAAPATSLKRNNDVKKEENLLLEQREGETPLKKSKTGGVLNNTLEQLEKDRRCKQCNFEKADCVVMPCGHLSLCSLCGGKTHACPLCKMKIQSTIKVFLV